MATIGKNILDNLTTGMYLDSKVIYREYIQNACDQIDLAIKEGILCKNEGIVDIFIDSKKRYISIKDNATGVKSSVFIDNLGDIANSNKEIGKNKGFRGIGRLCGLAYCKTLKFSTSYKGEKIKSIMICNAKKMREMLTENKKYTLNEIWDSIISFEKEEADEDLHFFDVEMFEINKENTDLLNSDEIYKYLSFVAPVPYRNTFIFRSKIYDYAKSINYNIDEYCIKINGCEIFKEYTTKIKKKTGQNLEIYDEILDLEFHNFKDSNGNCIAWMWLGLSTFEKQIPKINQMRGLRLRSSNIQIGDDDSLQHLFSEPRGIYYFIGEVFALDKNLIPNSQRNYFNENETRILFEDLLREYFYDELHKIYNKANNIKNWCKHINNYNSKSQEFESKCSKGDFVNINDKQRMIYDLEKSKKEYEEAVKNLNKFNDIDDNSPISKVNKFIQKKYNCKNINENNIEKTNPIIESNNKNLFITSNMSKLSRNERKLVSRILTIITDNIADKDLAEKIIQKIKEEMR